MAKAFDVLERSSWTRKELIAYEKMIDAERVERSVLKTAKINGREEGRQEERSKIVKEMLAENAKIEFICKVTGLSEQEVLELKSDMKN